MQYLDAYSKSQLMESKKNTYNNDASLEFGKSPLTRNLYSRHKMIYKYIFLMILFS